MSKGQKLIMSPLLAEDRTLVNSDQLSTVMQLVACSADVVVVRKNKNPSNA